MRYTKMAAIAIMVLGMMSVAAFTPRQPETAQPPAPAQARMLGTEPALQTFYVPAQHVNKARFEEPVQELY
jgi:hypothetical protein